MSSNVTLNEIGYDGDSNNVSDGYHTFGELYDHRISLFLALMAMSDRLGFECGWSKRHSDGGLCFGGGWCIGWITLPSGGQIRYHFEETRAKPDYLEKDLGPEWNGKEETIESLIAVTQFKKL